MTSHSDFLFARPSFLEGIARLFDFGNHLNEYNTSLTPEQADALALSADWWSIGDDLRLAIEEEAHSPDGETSSAPNRLGTLVAAR